MTTQELIEKINRALPQNNPVDITYSINEILLDIVNTLEGNGGDSGSEPLIYIANLTQSGTGAPVAVIVGNNTIGAIVWSRSSQGNYLGTLTGAFLVDKTYVIMSNNSIDDGGDIIQIITQRQNNNSITINTNKLFSPEDSILGGIAKNQIIIEVYP